jgi:ribonuclease-3
MSRLHTVLEELGIRVDAQLFALAFVHRSYAYENGGIPTNERLEFLGDSVLGVVVTSHLYESFPDLPEGRLARLRAAVVNARTLAGVARDLELGASLKLGKGELATGGANKDSILSDTVEALIAAIYLSSGFEAANRFVHWIFDPLVAEAARVGAGLDWKTSLQESCAAIGLPLPTYDITIAGPDHDRHFTAWAIVSRHRYGPGTGTSKKRAEQGAARIAFETLFSDEAGGEGSAASALTADTHG